MDISISRRVAFLKFLPDLLQQASAPAQETVPFRMDAHVLLSRDNTLVAHEYLLNVTPEQCGHHLDQLSGVYDLDITYGDAGQMAVDGLRVPVMTSNVSQRFETVEQWHQREPQAVQALLQPPLRYWQDHSEAGCQLWVA